MNDIRMRVRPESRTLQPVVGAPSLTTAWCDLKRTIEILDEHGERRPIDIPVERALTISIDGQELVTLMTLGVCPEYLVLGYLHNQRLIGDVTEIDSIAVDWRTNAAVVKTRFGAGNIAAKGARRIVTFGCAQGSVFGSAISQLGSIPLPSSAAARISQGGLYSLLETMRRQETLYRGAGSVHGCALFHGVDMLAFVEDVGRHNAIDTIIGWMIQFGVAGGDKIFYSTGRLTGEIVMKSAHTGVPIMVSRNGVTAMGVDVADKLGMTLIGRAVKRRFLCYAGAERFDSEPEPPVAPARTAVDK